MLSYKHRFHGYNSLRFVYKNGKTVRGAEITVRFINNPKRNATRVAVVVSKKTAKSAVTRNRIRRRVYEIFRKHLEDVEPGVDIVVTVVSDSVATKPPTELEELIIQLLTTSGVYKTNT